MFSRHARFFRGDTDGWVPFRVTADEPCSVNARLMSAAMIVRSTCDHSHNHQQSAPPNPRSLNPGPLPIS